ncbi:response regulator [Candidatus Omnitrophota bacterium]
MEIWGWGDKKKVIKKKILLIDDEVDFCYFTKKFLEHDKELEVIIENSARHGIDIAIEQKPDLILLDIMMPDMDGFAMLARLKNKIETRSIPVIMLTAKSGLKSIVQAQKSLVTDYIIKPFGPDKLLKAIKKCLGLKSNNEHAGKGKTQT